MSVPSLHEIAAMPLPASIMAIRKHYDPKWGTIEEDGEGPRKFRVRMQWTISGDFDDVIEAESAEEAKEIAQEYARDDVCSGAFESMCWSIKEVDA